MSLVTSLTDNEEGIDREKIFVLFHDNSIFILLHCSDRQREKC